MQQLEGTNTSINYLYAQVRTCLYGVNKANQSLFSKVLMDDCNGRKDYYSDMQELYII